MMERNGEVSLIDFPQYNVLRDVKLAWRDLRMRSGHPPEDSSPEEQQKLGLNRDVTFDPAEGEGEKLRRK
jgi:hypothetical protein